MGPLEGWDALGSYGLNEAQTSTSRALPEPMSAFRLCRGQSIDAPNKYTLNAALKEYTGAILWGQSMATLRRMYDAKVEVDLIALSIGTAACARTGIHKSMYSFREMFKLTVPNAYVAGKQREIQLFMTTISSLQLIF